MSGLSPGEDPHADDLADCAPAVRERLESIRAELAARVPGTTRCLARRMPALRKDRLIVHFAACRHHIGIYGSIQPGPHPRSLTEAMATKP